MTTGAARDEFYSAPAVATFGRLITPNETWLAKALVEEVLDPDLPIVDSHHHLWDHPGNRYLADELLMDLKSGHRIVATVAVEAGAMYRTDGPERFRPVGEVEFLDKVAAKSASHGTGSTEVAAAIVARADLSLGDEVADVLDALHAASPRVRSIRYFVGWDEDPEIVTPSQTRAQLLREPRVIAGARQVGNHGLSLEPTAFFTQLNDIAALATDLPDLRIVLGHVGMPLGYASYANRIGEVREVWWRGMQRLAQCPNVVVKLGGLMIRLAAYDYLHAPRPATSAELAEVWAPWILDTIELFGPARCAFESNFPPEKLGITYRALWNTFKLVTADASESERAQLFSATAGDLYGIRLIA